MSIDFVPPRLADVLSVGLEQFELECSRTAGPLGEDATYLALGLAGEAGEVAELRKKFLRGSHTATQHDEYVLDELGDLLWYLTMNTLHRGSSLLELMQREVNKLRRRYPNGFDPDAKLKEVG